MPSESLHRRRTDARSEERRNEEVAQIVEPPPFEAHTLTRCRKRFPEGKLSPRVAFACQRHGFIALATPEATKRSHEIYRERDDPLVA